MERLWPTPFEGEREVTLEANPGTVDLDKLRGFRGAGVNRMSFGVQSFHAHHLQRLGRIHDANQAKDALCLARDTGFANLSLDLIFALPEQTLAEWEADIASAISLEPDHISAYNLTYEESTPFETMRRRGELKPLAEEIEVAMFTRTRELLAGAGYQPYEISTSRRPDEPAATTSTTGVAATISASAPAHTRSPARRFPLAVGATRSCRRATSSVLRRPVSRELSRKPSRKNRHAASSSSSVSAAATASPPPTSRIASMRIS